MKLYLAHPFDSREHRRQWELHAEVVYDIEIINPFYDITRKDITEIDAGRKERYAANAEDIVLRDIDAIVNSDGIIAFIDGSLSYGTIMEIVYAYTTGVPVYICCTNGHHDHPWLVYHSDRIFTDLDQLEEFLAAQG